MRAKLEPSLARLWRYALMLSKARDAADDPRKPHDFAPASARINLPREHALTRWLFAILRSIRLNERSDRDGFGKAAVSSTRRIR